MAHATQAERVGRGDGNTILLLSLMLILLAFFILLNALSDFEEARTKQVIDSVNNAFRGQLEPVKVPALLNGSPGLLPEAEALVNEVGSLFESIIPAVRSTRTDHARVVHIDLPSGALFRVGDDNLRADRKLLIRRLARALLQRRAGGLAYKLAFMHGVPAGGAAGALREQEVRRASGLATLLVEEGMAPELLSIGVLPGRAGRVEFVLGFRDESPTAEESGPAGKGAP